MKKPLHLIYITGVGDQNVSGQQKAINTWSWYGVEAQIFQVKWGDKQPWQTKLDKLLGLIDSLITEGKDVALVGASAGASAAINAFAARKNVIKGVVCIAGKINNPETIGGRYLSQNPALLTSVESSHAAIKQLSASDRKKILSRYALIDGVVPTKDSRIEGARNRYSPTFIHTPTIAAQITLGAPSFIRFLKRQAKSN